MVRIPFLRTHARYREMADAFIDGELRAGDLAQFESHRATCAECMALVEAGHALKRSLRQVPEVAAPRSFRITPAMIEKAAPAPMRVTPMLMVARVGAAASVAAFMVVGTLQFSSTTGNDGSTAASPMGELATLSGMSEDFANDPYGSADASTDDGSTPGATSTETPLLAPAPSPQVGGAGAQEPTREVATDSSAVPPEGGDDDSQRSGHGGPIEPYGSADGDDFVTTAFAPAAESGANYGTWLVVLGSATIVALGTLGTLEFRRRRI